VEIKVTGLREIERQLKELGSKTGTKILRASMLAANKPILEQAKSNVAGISGGSGALHKSMGDRFYAGKAPADGLFDVPSMGGRFSVITAPMKKNRTAVALYNLVYKRKRRGIFHGHFLEFGTEKIKARPFLKPALDSKGPGAVQSLADELRKRIAKQLAANRKK